jgi:hypothetical protein
LLVTCVTLAALHLPAAAAEAIFPLASQIGLVPPAGMTASKSFSGFEDRQNGVYVRLIALPGKAFTEIDKTMSSEALRKQGMQIDKREPFALPTGIGTLLIARQDTKSGRIRKWLLIAPMGEVTALVSFELPVKTVAQYPDGTIRAALSSVVMRQKIPEEEQLALLPFKLGERGGMRMVRVVPGIGVQLTDGPQDTLEAYGQAHLVIAIAPGGPQRASDRDHFARLALSGLPPLKEVRITSSEPIRIGGQPGHEVRAEGRAPDSGAPVQIVQWLRFGTSGYLRILGIVPKDNWADAFPRFRAVRDRLEPK